MKGGWWEKFDSNYGYGCVTKPQGKFITIPWTSSWLSRLSMLKINITAWLDLINSHLYYEMYNVILPYKLYNYFFLCAPSICIYSFDSVNEYYSSKAHFNLLVPVRPVQNRTVSTFVWSFWFTGKWQDFHRKVYIFCIQDAKALISSMSSWHF